MKKKVVVTGANGFVGSYLVRKLIKHGFDVTAAVRDHADLSLLPVTCPTQVVDFTNDASIAELLSDQHIVIHLAGKTKAANYNEYKEANIQTTDRLVTAANNEESIWKFIFVSSLAAAGMPTNHTPKVETDACNPITDYGRTKLAAEQLIQRNCQKPWTIIRPAAVYGPGDKDFLQYFIMIKKHLALSIGRKDKFLSLIYVEELCELLLAVIDKPASDGEIFFAADGRKYSQQQFMNAVQESVDSFSFHFNVPEIVLTPVAIFSELAGKLRKQVPTINRQKVKEIQGDYWVCSIDKARSLLDFNPEPRLEDNLHKTWIWYKQQGWL